MMKTQTKNPKSVTLDEFHYHEALHTACVLMEAFGEHVADHPAIIQNPKLKKLADKSLNRGTNMAETRYVAVEESLIKAVIYYLTHYDPENPEPSSCAEDLQNLLDNEPTHTPEGFVVKRPHVSMQPGPPTPGCYCKPGKCGAPRPEWCRDEVKRDWKDKPAAVTSDEEIKF